MKKWKRFKKVIAMCLLAGTMVFQGHTLAWAKVTESENVENETSKEESTEEAKENKPHEISTDEFQLKISSGINGTYAYGVTVPITINVESKKADFAGTLRLIVPQVNVNDNGNYSVAYESDIMLSKGEPKNINLSTYLSSYSLRYIVELEDEKGNVVLSEKITSNGKAKSAIFIGALTQDYTSLEYFDGISLEEKMDTNCRTSVLELTSETFPEQKMGIDTLCYLIINDYDTSNLSEKQINVIKEWVENGGVLIIGTGANYQNTISNFDKDFVSIDDKGNYQGKMSVSSGKEAIDVYKEDGILNLSLDGGEAVEKVFKEDGLVWKKSYGKGDIVVTSFNLGLKPVTSMKEKEIVAKNILENGAGEYAAQRIYRLGEGDYDYISASTSKLGYLFSYKYPNLVFLVMILAVLLVLIIVVYLILRHLDKRQLIWIIIPAMSLVATVVLIVGTSDLRIKDVQTASVTTYCYDAQTKKSDTNASIKVLFPSVKEYDLDFSDKLASVNLKLNEYDDYYDSEEGNASVSPDYAYAIKEGSSGYSIRIKNDSNFGYNEFQFDSRESGAFVKDLDCSKLVMTMAGFEGTIQNNMEYDLKNVCIVSGSVIYPVGTIKSGKSVEVNVKNSKQGTNIDDWIYDTAKLSEEECVNRAIYNGFLMGDFSYLSDYGKNIVSVIGVLDKDDIDYLNNKNIKENNYAMIAQNVTMPLKGYEDKEIFSMLDYTDANKQWDSDGQMLDIEAEVNVELGEECKDIDAMYALPNPYSENNQAVSVSIWDYSKKAYVDVFVKEQIEEFGDKGKDYISDDGTVKLKFTCTNKYDDYSPEIMFVGGEK